MHSTGKLLGGCQLVFSDELPASADEIQLHIDPGISTASPFDDVLPTLITFCWGSQPAKNCQIGFWIHLWVISCWLSARRTCWMNPAPSAAKKRRELVSVGNHQSLISSTRIKQMLIYGLRVCVINSNEQRRELWGHFYEHISSPPSHPSVLSDLESWHLLVGFGSA